MKARAFRLWLALAWFSGLFPLQYLMKRAMEKRLGPADLNTVGWLRQIHRRSGRIHSVVREQRATTSEINTDTRAAYVIRVLLGQSTETCSSMRRIESLPKRVRRPCVRLVANSRPTHGTVQMRAKQGRSEYGQPTDNPK